MTSMFRIRSRVQVGGLRDHAVMRLMFLAIMMTETRSTNCVLEDLADTLSCSC